MLLFSGAIMSNQGDSPQKDQDHKEDQKAEGDQAQKGKAPA